MDDRCLLDRYLAARDENAFRELVGRHLDFVHAVARRSTGNDELARDAAQTTFVKLARDAARVPRELSLAAWLHRTCRCAAIDLVRTEDRRRKREQLAHQHTLMNPTPEPEWERIAPVIDEAVDRLPAPDRELVLAKYYRNESFAGIAARLGLTEVNARKRASRSLEKLRHLLGRRGLTTTAAALATALPVHAVTPAPASLAGAVLSAAGGIVPVTPQDLGIHFALSTMKKSSALAAAAALAASGWAGHALGNARQERSHVAATTPRSGARQADRPSQSRDQAGDPMAAFERLLAGRESRLWPVVSRLRADALPGAFDKLRELLAKAPKQSAEWRRLNEIESALYFRWAESDPQAALADVLAKPRPDDMWDKMKSRSLVESVLAAWMHVDANAAYAAVKDDKDYSHIGRDMLVRTWTPQTLFKNLELFPDKHRDLLGWYCVAAAEEESRRNAMLAALKEQPEMKDADWAKFLLFRSWGYKDFDAAVAEAEARKLPDTVKQLLNDNLPSNPAQAMPWAVQKGLPPGGPLWERGYENWLRDGNVEARAWFAEQAPLWEDKGHHTAVAGFLAKDLAFTSADLSGDPVKREDAEHELGAFMERWRSKDPDAAARWSDTAPKEARDFLAGKGGER